MGSLILPSGYKQEYVNITKTLALVKGVEMYLYSAPGMREGVCVDKADIDAGLVTEQQVEEAVGQAWLDQVGR